MPSLLGVVIFLFNKKSKGIHLVFKFRVLTVRTRCAINYKNKKQCQLGATSLLDTFSIKKNRNRVHNRY